MKGHWTPTPGSDTAGTYDDVRGVAWTVTSKPVGSGLIQQRQWMAQSNADGDGQKYFTQTGWTIRTRDDLFTAIDTWVGGGSAAAQASGGSGTLLLVALAFWLLTDKRRR